MNAYIVAGETFNLKKEHVHFVYNSCFFLHLVNGVFLTSQSNDIGIKNISFHFCICNGCYFMYVVCCWNRCVTGLSELW